MIVSHFLRNIWLLLADVTHQELVLKFIVTEYPWRSAKQQPFAQELSLRQRAATGGAALKEFHECAGEIVGNLLKSNSDGGGQSGFIH